MRPSSYLVVYKDGSDRPIMYFGPFHSETLASEFKEDLPEPRKGGFKKYAITQPFTYSEALVVAELINSKRN